MHAEVENARASGNLSAAPRHSSSAVGAARSSSCHVRMKKPTAPTRRATTGSAPPPRPEPTKRRGSKRVVNMHELASRAGVSASTVSRALAGSPLISTATRERLTALAQEMGYRVNSSASRLRRRRANTIGIVTPMGHGVEQYGAHPFLQTLLAGIADVLSERGLDLLLLRFHPNVEEWMEATLDAGRADGLIVLRQSTLHPALNAVARTHDRFVVWGQHLPDQAYLTVGSDNRQGGALAAGHLLERGRQRIAFLGDRGLNENAARYQGYAAALRAAGRKPERALDLVARYAPREPARALDRALDAGVEFDAVFAASDMLAIHAMRALAQRGRVVPGDVAIVGFDDIPVGALMAPALTTVRQDVATAARALVDTLLTRIEGRPASSAVLPVALATRESSGG